MAAIVLSSGKCILTSGRKIQVFDLSDNSKQELVIEEDANKEDQAKGNGNPPKDDANSDDEEEGKQKSQISGPSKIVVAAASPSGKYFCVCTEYKSLVLFSTGPTWEKISQRSTPRRCTSISFSNKEDIVVATETGGDVYSYQIEDSSAEGKLLLGHISMIRDVIFTKDDKYVITCDRDDKIRVSHYPNAYNIKQFLFGHNEFVTCLCDVDHEKHILSGSGDGTVRLWNYEDGNEVTCLNCKNNTSCNDEDDATVKFLRFCKKHKIVGVVVNSEVCIYKFENLAFQFLQKIPFKENVTFDFDDQGNLWCLEIVQNSCLSVYAMDENGQYQLTTNENINNLVEIINQDWEFFSVSAGYDDGMKELYKKKSRSNIGLEQYRERKNERIKGGPKRKKAKNN